MHTLNVQNMQCSKCQNDFSEADMVSVGSDWVCGACKESYAQEIREGVTGLEQEEDFVPPIGRFFGRLGILFLTGPIWGLLGTVVGMVGVFRSIAESGMGQPEALADYISNALWTTMLGMVAAVIGMFMTWGACFVWRFRSNFAYGMSIAMSVIMLFRFPIGTVMGVLFIVFSIYNKRRMKLVSRLAK